MAQLLDGIGVAGYRSFGEQLALFGPLSKINFIVGKNNSGKSNLLRFVENHLANGVAAVKNAGTISGMVPIDLHGGHSGTAPSIAIGLAPDSQQWTWAADRLRNSTLSAEEAEKALNSLGSALGADNGVAWLRASAPAFDGTWRLSPDLLSPDGPVRASLPDANWMLLQAVLSGSQGGGVSEWIDATLRSLWPTADQLPGIALVPDVRDIGDPSTPYAGLGGVGVVQRLAELQEPPFDQPAFRDRFDAILEFTQTVLDSPRARIRVPYDRNMILVRLNDLELPLSSLGTGVRQVIILAIAATSLDEHLVCIEEPEVHLHPVLQRKLIAYLQDRTTNQYLIATHSAHLLDAPGTAAFHVEEGDQGTRLAYADGEAARVRVCVDLGYRPSDLVQANSVIWVEGPSDRIYIKHWLALLAPELTEGIHYSIMFYGGRLLSHISGGELDTLVRDLIAVRRLNQHPAIIIDSDRDAQGRRLNATKTRVRREFEDTGGFVWITKGREIENYVPREILRKAVAEVHPMAGLKWNGAQYGKPLQLGGRGRAGHQPDKIAIARAAVSLGSPCSGLDLNLQTSRLAKYVRHANGIAALHT